MCFLRPCMWSRQKKGLMFRMATSDDRVKEDSEKKKTRRAYLSKRQRCHLAALWGNIQHL